MPAVPLLRVDNVRAALGQGAWCSASFTVPSGGLVRLTGPSGSGKTTLLRTLARLHPRAGGELALRDQAADAVAPTVWRRQVAYVAQRPAMLRGTVETNLRAGAAVAAANGRPHDPAEAGRVLDALGLPTSLLMQDAGTISGGEASRIAVARALLVQPAVLLLDECTAGLDAAAAEALVRLVRQVVEGEQCGAVVVAHTTAPWDDAFGATVSVERFS